MEINNMPTISLCMIVKNEENHLASCLDTVQGVVDEIIIADTGSTDRTVEIAKTYTPYVFPIEWTDDFSAARNQSISRATGDWILVLDADEVLENWNTDKMRNLLSNTDSGGIIVPIINILNQENRTSHSGVRLFKRNPHLQFTGIIHENIVPSLTENGYKIEEGPFTIVHYGYSVEVSNAKDKSNRNMTLLKKQLDQNPEDSFAWFNLGNEFQSLGQLDQAIDCNLKTLLYSSVDAYYRSHATRSLIEMFIKKENLAEALKYAQQAITAYPDFTDLYFLLGKIFFHAGKAEKSIVWFHRCIQMGEAPIYYFKVDGASTFLSMYGLALAYQELELLPEVVIYCTQALKYNSTYIPAINLLIEVLLKQETKQSIFNFIQKITDVSNNRVRDVLIEHNLL